jgi:chemotaxis family two-component system response regulator Rcp1
LVERVEQSIEILLVDDNPGDVRLTREALAGFQVPCRLSVVKDGVEAISFLGRQGEFAQAPRPHLILLDLNLPKKDGYEVLAEIKRDPMLKGIPVIVLTTSQAEEDILASYDLHANCYIAKPVEWHQFAAVIQSIVNFWLTVVRLPPDNLASARPSQDGKT